MSLDVYLESGNFYKTKAETEIYIRENGQTKSISRQEWDELYPGQEPVTIDSEDVFDNTVYHANITHNLNEMAEKAGIYKYLWRPDEINIQTAEQLIEPLTEGLKLLESDPEKFKLLNPENGWGNYELLVNFVKNYLAACLQHKDAKVSVSR